MTLIVSSMKLHPAHTLTLKVFKGKGKLRPSEVADQTGVARSVAHNRLETLRMKGHLAREFGNPGWLYFRAYK